MTERRRLEDNLRRRPRTCPKADRRKNEFLAMLAHELRNPLAPISNARGHCNSAGDAEAVQSAADMLERQVGQMSRLVDDLLDMSRITRGRIELRKRRVDRRGDRADQAVEESCSRRNSRSMNPTSRP